jgi:hypothetical protein
MGNRASVIKLPMAWSAIAPPKRRILAIADGFVRFWHMDKRTHRRETVRCTVKEFIDLWAQHIPQRYRRAVRYFGLFAPRRWAQVAAAVFTSSAHSSDHDPSAFRGWLPSKSWAARTRSWITRGSQ